MPHQRGDPHGFTARNARAAVLRDSREPPAHSLHPSEFQRRRFLVHHPSPGGQQPPHPSMHPGMYHGSHPHSPAGWYGSSVATNSPHRVPGSSLSVASNETMVEEPVVKKEPAVTPDAKKTPATADEEMRKKQEIIHEALRRHMDDDNSIGTNEADAASALLFATAAMRRAEQQKEQEKQAQQHSSKVSVAGSTKAESQGAEETEEKEHEDEEEEEDGEVTATSQDGGGEEKRKDETNESSVPLKKRRKLMNFLRKKPVTTATTEKQPLHVSPLPSPQVRSRVAGHESSEETLESNSPRRHAASSSSTCMDNSYDAKETHCLHDGSKIQNAAEISPPPSQVVIEHFPTVLHHILTNSEFAGSVVQWLPDGEAWKIIRWDALRRQVLPKYFPQLRDEDGKIGSSIDTFLWHLAGWGFEEIQDGPDVGAYKNKFFRKDSAQLCRQMMSAHKQVELESPRVAKKTPSTISDKLREASQPHSILQVPSLASRSESEACSKEVEKAALKWREEQLKRGAIHSPTVSYPAMAGRPMRHPETPIFVNYRMADIAYAAPEGWQYFPESPLGMRHLGSGVAGYEQRMLQQQRFEFPRSAALHGTPRVQSGRGALRLPIPSKAGIGNAAGSIRRSSFPVSNRGKGSRLAPGLRIPIAATSEIMRTREVKPAFEPEDSAGIAKAGEEVAERVAVAVSKKTKRKLPLSGSSSAASKSEAPKESKTPTKEEDV
ncbi:transcription factor [Seminavis robusta]|uniref:Transcription factor n=1 Tax=Seminavis robusta TaxID=568900 RepID=A0A9N8HPZ1_9STRA|nr:transcription factor [Seminavis robusta]|eukprot:Sro940_g222560.1 transcription factor (720) ;mRNA; r:13432-15689